MTEKQLVEKIKNLLQEKTEILEKMSEYDQKVIWNTSVSCLLIFCCWHDGTENQAVNVWAFFCHLYYIFLSIVSVSTTR